MSSNNQQVALTNTFRSYNSKVPMFLQKLYMIVDKEETNDVISWSQDGESFFVHDHERLAREHLPQWFKHNKFASFVRQLNMYGFHKVPHLQQGVLKSETEADQSQFIHPYFQRGKEDQLIFIERKKQTKDQATIEFEPADPSVPPTFPSGQALDIPAIVSGIAAIRRHQTTISQDLSELKRSDQLLWEEALQARNRYKQQQDTINRIVKFLANLLTQLASSSGKEKDSGHPRDSPHGIVPLQTPRLMIEDKRRDPGGSKVGIVEMEDEDAKDMAPSPASVKCPTVETPDSTVQRSSTTSEAVSPLISEISSFATPAVDLEYPPSPPNLNSVIGIGPPDPQPASQTEIDRRVPTPSLNGINLENLSTSDWDLISSMLGPLVTDPSQNDYSHLPIFDIGQSSPSRLPLTGSDYSSSHSPPCDGLDPQSPGALQKQFRHIGDIDHAVEALNGDIDSLSSVLGISPAGSQQVDTSGMPDIDYSSFLNYATPPPVDIANPLLDEMQSSDSAPSPVNNNLRQGSPFVLAQPPAVRQRSVDSGGGGTAEQDSAPVPATVPVPATAKGRKRKSDETQLDPPPPPSAAPKPPATSAAPPRRGRRNR